MRTRLAAGVVLASLLCVAAAAAVAVTWDHGPDAPPGLSAHMVRALDSQGWRVSVDEAATREAEDQARLLSARYGPTEDEPDREVAGVSLAQFQGRLVWVVAVENVTAHCFGPTDACGGDDGLATSVLILFPETLKVWEERELS